MRISRIKGDGHACHCESMNNRNSNLKGLELALLVGGAALMVSAAVIAVGGRIYSRQALARFQSVSASPPSGAPSGHSGVNEVDYSLWSPKRIEQYKASLAEHFDSPVAV